VSQDSLVPSPPATLVTGATGFVGSAVARALLARGHSLRLLVRPGSDQRNIRDLPAELVEGDLRDPASLLAAVEGCAYVVHVAADYRLWVPQPAPMMQANVDGTRALLLAARDAGARRIVYCSSVAALGLVGDGTPGTEETPVHEHAVVGAYKRSKYLAEQEVRRLVREEGVPAVIVNPSTPIGPRDIKPTPTGKMVLDAAAGRMPAYVDTGLNVVHVDDVGLGHVLALERGKVGEAYILGGTDLRLEEILAMIDDIMGRGTKRRHRLPRGALWPVALGMEGAARAFRIEPLVTREMLAMAKKQMFFSSAKAREKLGYAPRPARQALADAIAWFRAEGRLRA
jgi:dihydroflavonol-4-reductase